MSPSSKISVIYQKFSNAGGNQHIASEFAIRKIQGLIRNFDIPKVLEVGLGIGSISGILLSLNERLEYFGTEKNQFCLESLQGNLGQHYYRLQIFNNIKSISNGQKFELIIIDGKDGQLEKITELITVNGIIAIEGDRIEQLEVLKRKFPNNKIVHSISLVKNKHYSPFSSKSWQGGVKIIFVNPTKPQLLWWLKEKIKTKIKYQFPGRNLGGGKNL